MARITVEDCLGKVENRFSLMHLAAKRVLQLRKGTLRLMESKNKDVVVALREVAAELVTFDNVDQLAEGFRPAITLHTETE